MASRTLSFAVLSQLLTRLGGQPYPDYLRDQIFTPLGMRDTAFLPTAPHRAAPVHHSGESARRQRFRQRAIAGGRLWSTAAALVALGQTRLNGGQHGDYTLLGPATLATMRRLQASDKLDGGDGIAPPFSSGLGWGKGSLVPGAWGSATAYEPGGATGTRLWIDPDWDLVFVYLSNTWGDETETARRALKAV